PTSLSRARMVRPRIIYKNESDATTQIKRSPSDLAVFRRQADSQPGPTPLNFAPGSRLATEFRRDSMHQLVSANLDSSRRWWVLATVVAAQFMFGVDAFIVNVAIPTIAVELHASPTQIESVIAIYLIAYATLVVTGGRLGDIYGTKVVFL